MELPGLGRLFSRNKGETQSHTPQRPPVDKTEISRRIVAKFGYRTPGTEDQIMKDASAQDFEYLATTTRIRDASRKFVREGDRIVLGNLMANHIDLAGLSGMLHPDDAGLIDRDSKRIKEGILLIQEGSDTLAIPAGNINRPETLEILKKIAPEVKIEELIPPEL